MTRILKQSQILRRIFK